MAAVSYMSAHGQTYLTRNGQVSFYSKTPMEDIKAVNKQVYAAIDLSTKTVAFTLLLKAFLFDKQLMQDHFNENYVESDKYPKASFTGSFKENIPATPGKYPVEIQGQLTLHGVSQPVKIPATLEIMPKGLSSTAIFTVRPSDYNIKIPSLVKEKIASQITVEVSANCSTVK
ncbi:YceI family protein [Filimonas effusa]|nr:YceI family protein [Filimonas effusa]